MARTKRQRLAAKARKTARDLYGEYRDEVMTAQREPQEDPRAVAIAARIRAGAPDANEAQRPMWGEAAGQAIAQQAPAEAAELWDTFKRIDAADDAYARRFTGIRRFPNVTKLEMMPERFETRDDDRPDSRTPDEKDRDAVAAWTRWQGLLSRLRQDQHAIITDAMRHRARLMHGGKPTKAGKAFVAAMQALDAHYRGR